MGSGLNKIEQMDLDQWTEWLYDGIDWDYLMAFRAWCNADYHNWQKVMNIIDEVDRFYLQRSKHNA